jgi:glutathione S-transferase
MPTLYFAPGACSLAPHIVLEWIGAPYNAVKVDQHAPEYRKINPAGAVPALDYGGDHPLTQCSAILLYLAQTHPEANLLDDRSPENAAQLQKWAAFLTGDLHPAFFPLFMPKRYTISPDPAAQADVVAAGTALVQSKLKLLDQQLEGHDWVVGDKRTIIDAYATPMLNWAAAKLPGGLQAYPACQAHHDLMLADPAVQRVMEAESA